MYGLLEVLKDCGLCTYVKIRYGPMSNNFTSISTKSCASVDYCIVPVEDLNLFMNLEILTMGTVIDQLDIRGLTKLSDHAILKWQFTLEHIQYRGRASQQPSTSLRKFRPSSNFPVEDRTINGVHSLTQALNSNIDNGDVDVIYGTCTNLVLKEINIKQIKGRAVVVKAGGLMPYLIYVQI